MNINIYNYLQNFEEMDLPNENGVILEDDKRIKKLHSLYDSYNDNYYYSIDNKFFLYVKKMVDTYGNTSARMISELLASRIYEKNGVNCIRTFPFRQIEEDNLSEIICSASEDLTKIDGLQINNDYDFMDDKLAEFFKKNDNEIKTNDFLSDEWLIVTNQKVKEYLLKYMNKEAYEQLVDLLIIDTLFYIWDRFGFAKNLFYAKTPEADKIEGVIPIDLESINFDNLKPAYINSANKFVKDLYSDKVLYVSPQGTGLGKHYKERILNLKKVMNEGYFTPRQVSLIKNVLSSNITNEIEDILNKYNLDCSKKVMKVYREIWNRNADLLQL